MFVEFLNVITGGNMFMLFLFVVFVMCVVAILKYFIKKWKPSVEDYKIQLIVAGVSFLFVGAYAYFATLPKEPLGYFHIVVLCLLIVVFSLGAYLIAEDFVLKLAKYLSQGLITQLDGTPTLWEDDQALGNISENEKLPE